MNWKGRKDRIFASSLFFAGQFLSSRWVSGGIFFPTSSFCHLLSFPDEKGWRASELFIDEEEGRKTGKKTGHPSH